MQNYTECARRFQLRYVERRVWPALQAEPAFEHERYLERGALFHRLVERHQLGMELGLLESGIRGDEELLAWWRAYLAFDFLHSLEGARYSEFALSAVLDGRRLTAVYDLLVVQPGEHVYIFDWKTSRRSPRRRWFEQRLQTRVYPVVLLMAGSDLFGEPLSAEQVEMVYWVSGEVVSLPYSDGRFSEDSAYLTRLLAEIGAQSGDVWPLTADESRCRFCEYRSLCERGVVAGDFAGEIVDFPVGLDEVVFGDVGEDSF